ncbi:antitoxin VbhA family protein [Avibacterium sp. 21-586]|uniref:antitoxin VbhA family protein n=1 Tax=Avibacterium sp. 21-586 TaxID=2911534 RepID=UPI002247D5A0|nr:antitoxin VbhA family protein [Avibacterium sp. 21-586]MCW9710142.1 antitoxin VbhA family protein [Avibacterium sp. 21-586]
MISETEKAKRREAVEYAKASVGLEGIILSDSLLKIADKFINGDLTIEEFGEEYELALQKGL